MKENLFILNKIDKETNDVVTKDMTNMFRK